MIMLGKHLVANQDRVTAANPHQLSSSFDPGNLVILNSKEQLNIVRNRDCSVKVLLMC